MQSRRQVFLCVTFCFLLSTVALAGTTVVKDPMAGEKVNPSVSPPSRLRIDIVPSGFQLHWKGSAQDPGKVTGYEIVRALAFSGPFTRVTMVKSGVLAYIDRTVSPDQIYFYKVRAIAGDEYSHFSNLAAGERPSNIGR
jgi:hypothetical protein